MTQNARRRCWWDVVLAASTVALAVAGWRATEEVNAALGVIVAGLLLALLIAVRRLQRTLELLAADPGSAAEDDHTATARPNGALVTDDQRCPRVSLEVAPYLTEIIPGAQRRAALRVRSHRKESVTIETVAWECETAVRVEAADREPPFALGGGETCLLWVDSFPHQMAPDATATGQLILGFGDGRSPASSARWQVTLDDLGRVDKVTAAANR